MASSTGVQPIQGDLSPYIAASAKAHGVDPNVALAVAEGEGGLRGPTPQGDGGTSFGPYQLHIGGALPSTLWNNKALAQRWANSPQGIDYAMVRIAAATKGLSGAAAIKAAVDNFERPAAPGPEVARDVAYYNSLAGAGGGSGGIGPSGGLGGGSSYTPGGSAAAATLAQSAGAASSNPGGKLFQCTSSGGGSLLGALESAGTLGAAGGSVQSYVGNLTGLSLVPCYLESTMLFLVYAFGGLAATVAGVMLVWPRGGKALRGALSPVPLAGRVGALAASRVPAEAREQASARPSEARAAELHAERVKQARARTSETRAKARVQRSRARQEKLATGSSTRLSSVEEQRIRRAQQRVGNKHPERMRG